MNKVTIETDDQIITIGRKKSETEIYKLISDAIKAYIGNEYGNTKFSLWNLVSLLGEFIDDNACKTNYRTDDNVALVFEIIWGLYDKEPKEEIHRLIDEYYAGKKEA